MKPGKASNRAEESSFLSIPAMELELKDEFNMEEIPTVGGEEKLIRV